MTSLKWGSVIQYNIEENLSSFIAVLHFGINTFISIDTCLFTKSLVGP